MIRRIAVLLGTVALAAGCGAGGGDQAGSLEAGNAAFQQRDYRTAYEELLPAAVAGNAEAQFKIGWMYLMGQGVSVDYEEADSWLRKAAEHAYPEALYTLGLNFELGRGVTRDPIEAYAWTSLAVTKGYPAAVQLRDDLATRMSNDEIVEARRLAAERLENLENH